MNRNGADGFGKSVWRAVLNGQCTKSGWMPWRGMRDVKTVVPFMVVVSVLIWISMRSLYYKFWATFLWMVIGVGLVIWFRFERHWRNKVHQDMWE